MAHTTIQNITKIWVASFREHFVFIAIIGLYCLVVQLIGYLYGVQGSIGFKLYSTDLFDYIRWFVVIFVLGHTIYVMVVIHPKRLISYLFQEWQNRFLKPQRLINTFFVLLLLPLFMSAFSSFKSLIPVINPFLWDETFQYVDHFIHFGHHPWELIQPYLDQPISSFRINFIYHLWVFVMNGMLLWQICTLKDSLLRMQFLLCFLLLWVVLGSVLATIFASVGPCYYGEVVVGINPYEDLLGYLWDAHNYQTLWALDMQKKLWDGYQLAAVTQGSGVSAMPSLHVATSVLFALLAWRTNKALGVLLTGFCCLIFIGSIHLGWHYAIDGYVSIIMTLLIWKCVGWFLIRQEA